MAPSDPIFKAWRPALVAFFMRWQFASPISFGRMRQSCSQVVTICVSQLRQKLVTQMRKCFATNRMSVGLCR